MNLSYKRKHNDSYMILNVNGESGYEEKMIENNDISSLLEISKLELNGEQQYWYNISKKESLRDYFDAEELDLEMIKKLLLYIHIDLEEIGKYLINQNHIYLSPDTIYLEKGLEEYKVSLTYCPDVNETVQQQFRSVIEYLIEAQPSGRGPLRDSLNKIYEKSLKEDYTIMELVETLSDFAGETKEVENNYEKERYENIKVEEIELEDEDDDAEFLSDYYDEPKESKSLFGGFKLFGKKEKEEQPVVKRKFEDFIVEPDMEINEPTVLLKPEDIKCTGKLTYDGMGQEENFMVVKDVFRIGSSENNDAILKSKAVSRHHAKIVRKNGDFWLEDSNSTNGTWLNGQQLEYKNPVKLKSMDQISFADAKYVFV